ncbi:hypothetical protein VTH06DRAFT_4939 [Thermothelomyces fergusii]
MAPTDLAAESLTTPTKYALLIGIDHYYGSQVMGDLNGCVRDVEAAETYLKQYAGVTDMVKLISPRPGSVESSSESDLVLPTRANVVDAFRRIAEKVQRGDYVYIHYSGHGMSITTVFGDLKQNGLDEAFVLLNDLANEGDKIDYLRDVEVAYLVKGITDKHATVNLVLDCCNSGGAFRGRTIRGLGFVKDEKLVDRPLIDAPEKLLGAWDPLPSRRSGRGASVLHHWMTACDGVEVLAACRADQYANEVTEPNEPQGLMSKCLGEVIAKYGARLAGLSCRNLQNLVAKRVADYVKENAGELSAQDVVFGGRGTRAFFGTDEVEEPPVVVTAVEATAGGGIRVRLSAGTAHGVREGDVFALYPPAHEFHTTVDYNAFVARCDVKRVDDFECQANLSFGEEKREEDGADEAGAETVVQTGCRAVNLRKFFFDKVMKPRAFRLVGEDGAWDPSFEALGRRIERQAQLVNCVGQGSQGGAEPFFDVRVLPSGDFLIGFTPNPETGERATVEAGSVRELQAYLAHLTVFYNIFDLAVPVDGGSSSWAAKTGVSVEVLGYLPAESDPPPPSLVDPSGKPPPYLALLKPVPAEGPVEIAEGDIVAIRVTNRSRNAVNVEVLDLEPSWKATRIYPDDGAPIQLVANEAADFFVIMSAPDAVPRAHQPEDHDTIVVLATASPEPNFVRAAILPTLDQSAKKGYPPLADGDGLRGAAPVRKPTFFAKRAGVRVVPRAAEE